MTDAKTLANLMNSLNYLERAFGLLEGIDGMERYQEDIACLIMDIDSELQEAVQVIG